MSIQPHPPKTYLHLSPTTPHSSIKIVQPPLSTQKIPPPTPTHPRATSIHRKLTFTYPQPSRIYLHPSLSTHKKMSTQPHPTKIYLQTSPPTIKNFHSLSITQDNLYPPPPHNIKPPIIVYRRVVFKFKSQYLDFYSFYSIVLRKDYYF